MPAPEDALVTVTEWRASWRMSWRRMWTLDIHMLNIPTLTVESVGVTQSRANIRDADSMVNDYLATLGYGYIRPEPASVLYEFNPASVAK